MTTKTTAWAVFNGQGVMVLSTVRRTRKIAIDDFTQKMLITTWDMLLKKGWACRKVTISVNKEGK